MEGVFVVLCRNIYNNQQRDLLDNVEKRVEVNILIKNLSLETNYWLVRTSGGSFYDEFVAENYIAIGWNEISDLEEIKQTKSDTNIKDRLMDKIKKLKTDDGKEEPQPGRIYSQITKFVNEMTEGDIVLIPSQKSNLIEFGVIESDPHIIDKKIFNTEDGECDFLKRRKVRWLHRVKRSTMDPYLNGLLNSHHTISSANEYAHFIDRTLHGLYIKGDKAHLILDVKRDTDISVIDLTNLVNSTVNLLDDFNIITGSQYDKNQVQIKLTLQSPGAIELFGHIDLILGIAFVYAVTFGADFGVLGLKFKTEGISKTILDFMEQHKKYNLENKKLELQKVLASMQVKMPSELPGDYPKIQEEEENI